MASAILVPPPVGPYDVAMRVESITDPSRPADPLDANNHVHGRRILFSIFLPVEKRGTPCPSMKAAEAGLDDGLFSSFDMELCDLDRLNPCGGGDQRRKEYAVALFTPGLSDSRLLYGAGARSLASQGYVVVTVDHPYEADFVEFPDGTVIVGRNISGDDEPAKEKAIKVRAADLSYIIDQLHNRTLTKSLLDKFPGSLDLGKIAVYAHSVGGGAAATLARNDKRVLGGPFLLAGRRGHSAANSTDPTWNQFWPRLTGPRVELAINGTAHGSYTDRPLLVSALGLPDAVLDRLAGDIGSVRGPELERIVNGVLASFFDFVFYGKKQRLVRLPRVYSEVSITRSNF
ncbi:hypothetical protein H634G_06555 [Metarhizium anisopliae BRIP 53293]|uniref:1-alkyl-2-acetylglycerophosphocholine esterase n=1 Tax=Metarhizium anisopliae BRIP 53293 TaxID=1291518 RepID=A0A0D9NWE8_METAN|nr:hypothetical protein H634G_06555 [Metarhizium anisopliae BRIP 53293]